MKLTFWFVQNSSYQIYVYNTGEDGPSQMALEDLAMFRAIPTCTVFYPSDAVSMERAVELAANTKGMCFIRSSRAATSVIYENNAQFTVGKAHVSEPLFLSVLIYLLIPNYLVSFVI